MQCYYNPIDYILYAVPFIPLAYSTTGSLYLPPTFTHFTCLPTSSLYICAFFWINQFFLASLFSTVILLKNLMKREIYVLLDLWMNDDNVLILKCLLKVYH